MSINETLSVPVVKSNFFKFSNTVFISIFSFLDVQEISTIASCNKIFPPLQERYLKNLMNREAAALIKLIASKEKFFSLKELVWQIKIYKGYLSSTTSFPGKRIYLDLKNLKICSEIIDDSSKPIQGGPENEKVSAVLQNSLKRKTPILITIDNKKRCIIDRIALPINPKIYDKYIAIFGTGQEPGSPLEIVTDKGEIFFYTPNCAERESDKKESDAKLKQFCCIPEEYRQEFSKAYTTRERVNCLLQAYKIKNSYYFEWRIKSFQSSQQVITFVSDIFKNNHLTLLHNPSYCCADNNFFYAAFENAISIFKNGELWKTLNLGSRICKQIKMNPTEYGLVVSYHESEIANDRTYQCLAIWNQKYRNASSHTTEEPFFYKKFDKDWIVTQFVSKNVFFYKIKTEWLIYHIPTKTEIGKLNIPDIMDIFISDEPVPKYLVVNSEVDDSNGFLIFCVDEENNK